MESVWKLDRMDLAGFAAEPGAGEAGEAALVQAALKGDQGAFTELVRLHQRRVFRLAGRFFRAREDVEEVAQETFLAAWKGLAGWRGDAPFEHWLTRICLRCCYARMRKTARPEVPLSYEPAAAPSDPDAALDVGLLLGRLDPKDRFLLLLLEGEGLSVAEIAGRLGWSRVNVKVRAHRARRKLRAILEER